MFTHPVTTARTDTDAAVPLSRAKREDAKRSALHVAQRQFGRLSSIVLEWALPRGPLTTWPPSALE